MTVRSCCGIAIFLRFPIPVCVMLVFLPKAFVGGVIGKRGNELCLLLCCCFIVSYVDMIYVEISD